MATITSKIRQHEDQCGAIIESYPPTFSDAALLAVHRWGRQEIRYCDRFGKWLMAFADAERERRTEDDPPIETTLPRFDADAYASYELILVMNAAHAMAIASKGASAALSQFARLIYAHATAAAEQRVRRLEP